MLPKMRFFLLGLCVITSLITASSGNPLKAPLEVLKAIDIGQTQLQYSNDIAYLVRNGNEWAFVMALALKYGYNPIGEKPFKNLNLIKAGVTAKDFAHYFATLQQIKAALIAEQQKKESSHQEMITEGSVQTFASIIGFMLLKLAPGPIKLVAIPCLAYATIAGVKKAHDGVFYQEYLANRIERNKDMQEVLKHAAAQLGNNSAEIVSQTAQKVAQKAEETAGKINEKIKGKNK